MFGVFGESYIFSYNIIDCFVYMFGVLIMVCKVGSFGSFVYGFEWLI